MALPSVVTLGSMAFVVCAGVGLVAVSSSASDVARPGAGPSVRAPRTEPAATVPPPTRTPDRTRPDSPDRHVKSTKTVDVVPETLVMVYNNSGIAGLAADRAAFLDGAGWQVAATGNWYGDIVADTVYYPPKLRPDAAQLSDVLGVTRLRPSVSPMQFDRLTVIFTQA